MEIFAATSTWQSVLLNNLIWNNSTITAYPIENVNERHDLQLRQRMKKLHEIVNQNPYDQGTASQQVFIAEKEKTILKEGYIIS